MKKIIITIALLALFLGCNDEPQQKHPLLGKWQLVKVWGFLGANGNVVANGRWVDVNDGYIIDLKEDNTFAYSSKDKNIECTEGVYYTDLIGNKLFLDFECISKNTNKKSTSREVYRYSFKGELLFLVFDGLDCIEGCGEMLKKISKRENGG